MHQRPMPVCRLRLHRTPSMPPPCNPPGRRRRAAHPRRNPRDRGQRAPRSRPLPPPVPPAPAAPRVPAPGLPPVCRMVRVSEMGVVLTAHSDSVRQHRFRRGNRMCSAPPALYTSILYKYHVHQGVWLGWFAGHGFDTAVIAGVAAEASRGRNTSRANGAVHARI
eukprot:365531-Chlamydomonas_euryale.AAC.9